MATKKQWKDGEERRESGAAKMTRSRSQLATAYAPGAVFTFEGGLGACLSLPDQSQNPHRAEVSRETFDQIHLRLREIWQSWFSRAMQAGTPDHPPVAGQCLDSQLLRDDVYRDQPPSKFELVDPKAMCYVPAPLDFVCNTCGRFRKFDSVDEASRHLDELRKTNCDSRDQAQRGNCRWRQLDVIFVHWSGHWEAPTPGRWEWNVQEQRLGKPSPSCPICQSRKFYLIDKSPRIGEWVFECEEGHKQGDSWLQNDPETTQMLGDEAIRRPPRWRRMEPISYRAAPAFYPHSEQLIVFSADQYDLLELLQADNESRLAGFIAELYGLGERPPTDSEIVEMLRRAGHTEKVSSYESAAAMLSWPGIAGVAAAEEQVKNVLRGIVSGWKEVPGLVPVEHEAPAWLSAQILYRREYGSRYDPFVLAVEHEALSRNTIRATRPVDGRSPFVRFTHLDKDLAPRSQGELESQQRRTAQLLGALGIEDMGLVREFDLCRFTHGYTRMSTEPWIEKSDQQALTLPVRLNLFQALGNNKIPIYVVNQKNEAFYVRLSPAKVHEWLRVIGVADLPEWDPSESAKLGAHLLESATPFGKFFANLNPGPANAYRYVYTLLHTYAHGLIKSIAEFSGLDVGSLGEYLFPADLAFVVYRNGTTMDLGNLSALWRNYSNIFLEHLLAPRTLMCGAGSLCDTSGGACPSCIVIPETSCVAANRLLSRSVLRGGPAPREHLQENGLIIPGYIDMASGGQID
ncbi:hypothetical protein D7Y42_12270 [Stenotrophomonas maltophilia]|uniref:hypothetical protein n=1 Tax=Stenotrophomonas maltophilia TaxID=40324 RepID=UPI000D675D39|nr:hypothetical protein [Stenotrophomonas maltophilia]EKT4073625.1 hypothetical protein [Stenotrophomonas maltophilia]EKT4082036.1 hypothetical protein [Stenotrophomonas maltophilia]MBA0371468.1 hypothetical protein [Stenotrophomonas maltophilia]MBA0376532.1 hypothetical protein [Stenotrophomonas maltophilia]MBA0546086.1 hypothetical protein [Stenotrophomonas maltophilia]